MFEKNQLTMRPWEECAHTKVKFLCLASQEHTFEQIGKAVAKYREIRDNINNAGIKFYVSVQVCNFHIFLCDYILWLQGFIG